MPSADGPTPGNFWISHVGSPSAKTARENGGAIWIVTAWPREEVFHDRGGPAMNAQPEKSLFQVKGHSLGAEAEPVGDLFITETERDQGKDLALSDG